MKNKHPRRLRAARHDAARMLVALQSAPLRMAWRYRFRTWLSNKLLPKGVLDYRAIATIKVIEHMD